MGTAHLSEAIYTRLAADTDVKALVVARIYPLLAPPDADLPFLVYTLVSRTHDHGVCGTVGLAYARMQIDSYASDHLAALDLAEAVRQALDNFRGTITVGSDTLVIDVMTLDSESTPPADLEGGKDERIGRVSQDYQIGHKESVPSH